MFKSGIDEGRVKVPAAPHAYAPGRYWAPYRRAPTGIVDKRRIGWVVVEENKEETRSKLYILGTRRDRISTSINGTNVRQAASYNK
jgi:hypothetical protein